MGIKLEYIDGQTPIDEEEKEGLKIKTISNRTELDEFEQLNIERALEWLYNKKLPATKILSAEFIKQLHVRMFGMVWSWAGNYRTSNKNIGVPYYQINTALFQLINDSNYWLSNNTYTPDEFAIRFKHRIVQIHCFSNGNGRHSRLMADIIVSQLFNAPVFTWNNSNLIDANVSRKTYIAAVKAADMGDFSKLLLFARS